MAPKVTTDEIRRTVRTVLAVAATLAALVPVLVQIGVVDAQRWPWMATVVVVAGMVTRFMQAPAVDEVLTRAGVGRAPRVVPGEVLEPDPPVDQPVDLADTDPAAERSAGAP